jgi:hypothetical protein
MSRTRSIVGRLLIGVVSAWNVHNAAPSAAPGGLLSPADFSPLAPSLSEAGSYWVDTAAGTMTLPDGTQVSGAISDGVAVFTFGSIDVSGASFAGQGSNPFALLSRGNLTLNHVGVDVGAYGQTPGPGGNIPAGQGQSIGWSGAGGGGFGTAGGNGAP